MAVFESETSPSKQAGWGAFEVENGMSFDMERINCEGGHGLTAHEADIAGCTQHTLSPPQRDPPGRLSERACAFRQLRQLRC